VKQSSLIISTILTIYFVAMLMLISYLIYAKFSPIYQEIYHPTEIQKAQTSLDPSRVTCQTDSDCVIDSCHSCQAINQHYLTEPNLCYMYCPFLAVCSDEVCAKLPL